MNDQPNILHDHDSPMRPYENWDSEELVEERQFFLDEVERLLDDLRREDLARLMEIERELTLREEK